jgi:hypothetical protein
MKPYGISKAVVRGYDAASAAVTGKIGKNKSCTRQIWKGKARQEAKRDLNRSLK